MTMMISGNGNSSGQSVDTGLTKVFVGGLAWETPKEAMRDHFHQYGDILEAVIISDKLTGRSKGYGFVTFKDAEAAKRACEDPTPIINGRRANCNLAALGARRPSSRSSSSTANNTNPTPQHVNVGPRAAAAAASTPPPSHVQWYLPTGGAPYHHGQQQQPPQAVPFYSYSPPPTYIAASDMNYNHNKLGSYMNYGSQVYHPAGQAMVGPNALLPFYPLYQYFHHHSQSQAMGLPAHLYSPVPTLPALMPKPTPMLPHPLPNAAGTAAVGQLS